MNFIDDMRKAVNSKHIAMRLSFINELERIRRYRKLIQDHDVDGTGKELIARLDIEEQRLLTVIEEMDILQNKMMNQSKI